MLFLLSIQVTKHLKGDENFYLSVEVTSPAPSQFSTQLTYKKNTGDSFDTINLLKQLPGISLMPQGGKTDSTVLSIAGMSGKQLSIVLNGMVYETTTGNFNLLALPGEIKSIEIATSSDSNTGSGQGGTIIITSDELTCRSNLQFEISSEDYNKFTANFCYEKKFKYNFSFGVIKSKGNYSFINNNGTFQDSSDDFKDIRRNNNFSKEFMEFSVKNNNFNLNGNFTKIEKGEPGLISFPSLTAHSNNKSYSLILKWKGINKKIWGGVIGENSFFTDPKGDFAGYPLYISDNFYQFEQGGSLGKRKGIFFNLINWRIRRLLLNGNYYGYKNRSVFHISEQLNFTQNTFISQISISAEKLSDIYLPDYSYTAGIKYEIIKKIFTGLNFNRHYRFPTLKELYYNHGYIEGNNNLKTEHGYLIDFFLKTDGELNYSIRVYKDTVRDMIDYFLVSGFRYKPLNLGEVDKKGIDFQINYNYNKTADISSTLSYFYGRYTKDNLKGFIPNYPQWKLFSKLSLGNKYKITASFLLEKEIYLNLSNSKVIPFQKKVSSTFKIIQNNFIFILGVTNILNDQFYTYKYYPVPLREWFFKINFSM